MRVSSTASAKRPGSLAKPGASSAITAGVNSERNRQQHDLAGEQQREDAVGEQLAPDQRRPSLADARIGRHEGGVEGAFGEDRAEMIGQPQRDEEGIGDRPGAEHRRQHDVAHEAGDARQQRQAADGEDASEHAAFQKSANQASGISRSAITDQQSRENAVRTPNT